MHLTTGEFNVESGMAESLRSCFYISLFRFKSYLTAANKESVNIIQLGEAEFIHSTFHFPHSTL